MTTRGLVTKANKVPLLKDRRGQYFARNNGFAWYYNP
jgi:hypothetical protein